MTTLINLPGWEVVSVKHTAHDYHIEARYTVEPTACPHCQQALLFGSLYKHGSKPQLIMDLPARGKRVGIHLKRQRYRCRNCEKTFPQPLPDVDERCSMTRRLVQFIEVESVKRKFVAIADEVGVNEKTVRNVFQAYVAWLDEHVSFEVPVWMGMDEVHLLKKPRLIITNVKERTIVAVEPERDKKTVLAYLHGLKDAKDRVEVVTMDMWKPYRGAVQKELPKATIIIDKFHVVRMANQCLDALRKKLREGMSTAERRRLMRERFLLLRRPKDLKEEGRAKLEAWLTAMPALRAAYDLKEAFFRVFDLEQRDAAWKACQAWEDSMDTDMKTVFRPLLTAVYNWQTEIFNYFDHLATNACTEALNGIAKHINRDGRGYSFAAIRAKMLYSRTLQKERRPAFGDEGCEMDYHRGPEPDFALPMLEYLEHREGLTEEDLPGTDIMLLWAMLDPDSVEKANGNGRHRSTESDDET